MLLKQREDNSHFLPVRLWGFKKHPQQLCIVPTYNYNFKVQKAMYGIIKKIREFNLPLECQLDLFDKVVVPVLLLSLIHI